MKKTITYSELKRLSFCNSKDLPKIVIIGDVLHEWMSIGWVEEDKAKPEDYEIYPTVVEG